jgi:uncharacterized GH25 family protein
MLMARRHNCPGRALWAWGLALLATSAMAHDFWIQPNDYWVDPMNPVGFSLQVGHGPYRQRSPIALGRIVRFEAISVDGSKIDLRDRMKLGGQLDDGHIAFSKPGTYVLVMETDARAQSHLPAIRFNDYLKVEGLTPALEQRERIHRTDADGSENYSRRAKSLVQVGPPDATTNAQVTVPLGLPLEIVPEQNPYAVPQSATLPVRVIYEGRPLTGALIKLTNLQHDQAPFETHLTDREGRARFAMPTQGVWLLNVIWTKVLPSARETDFETVFSSLSFGFPPNRRAYSRPVPRLHLSKGPFSANH